MFYDQKRYDLQDNWMYERADDEDESIVFHKKSWEVPHYKDVRENFQEIVKLLYTQGTLDMDKLDDMISYLAEELDIKKPSDTLYIERKRDSQNTFYMSLGADLARLQLHK